MEVSIRWRQLHTRHDFIWHEVRWRRAVSILVAQVGLRWDRWQRKRWWRLDSIVVLFAYRLLLVYTLGQPFVRIVICLYILFAVPDHIILNESLRVLDGIRYRTMITLLLVIYLREQDLFWWAFAQLLRVLLFVQILVRDGEVVMSNWYLSCFASHLLGVEAFGDLMGSVSSMHCVDRKSRYWSFGHLLDLLESLLSFHSFKIFHIFKFFMCVSSISWDSHHRYWHHMRRHMSALWK